MRARAVVQPLIPKAAADVGAAYSEAGDRYLAYADGDLQRLYDFSGPYAYGDRCVWRQLEGLLTELRASGRKELTILDAGCGPGTWLRRIVHRASELGFDSITARGFDLADLQISAAVQLAGDLEGLPGVKVRFEVGDMTRALPEADGSIDLCVCLYGVLNHIDAPHRPAVIAEFARVTRGAFVTTVRTAGSTPSIFIGSVDEARSFRQDNEADRCDVELRNGRRISLPCHLFTARELWRLFAQGFDVEDLRGLDLFHSRFSPDPRWNPEFLRADNLQVELQRLEETYARSPGFIDRAAHLLLVARPKAAASS